MFDVVALVVDCWWFLNVVACACGWYVCCRCVFVGVGVVGVGVAVVACCCGRYCSCVLLSLLMQLVVVAVVVRVGCCCRFCCV